MTASKYLIPFFNVSLISYSPGHVGMRQSRNQVESEHVRPVHACPRSHLEHQIVEELLHARSLNQQQFGNSQDMWISMFFFRSTSPPVEYVFRLVLHAAWYHVTGEKRKAFFGRTDKKSASFTRSSVWTCFWSCSRQGWRGRACFNVRLSWRWTARWTLDLDQVVEYYIWQAWSTRRCSVIRWCKLNFRLA